jgi:hypothetical protein
VNSDCARAGEHAKAAAVSAANKTEDEYIRDMATSIGPSPVFVEAKPEKVQRFPSAHGQKIANAGNRRGAAAFGGV